MTVMQMLPQREHTPSGQQVEVLYEYQPFYDQYQSPAEVDPGKGEIRAGQLIVFASRNDRKALDTVHDIRMGQIESVIHLESIPEAIARAGLNPRKILALISI